MKEDIKDFAVLLFVGVLIGIGMKAVDWAIPRPPSKIEVIHKVNDASTCLREKGSV